MLATIRKVFNAFRTWLADFIRPAGGGGSGPPTLPQGVDGSGSPTRSK